MFSNLFSEQTIKRAKEEKLFRAYMDKISDGKYIVVANAIYGAAIPMDSVSYDLSVIYEKTTGKFPIFEDSESETRYLIHKASLKEVVGNMYSFKKEDIKPFLGELNYECNNQSLYFKSLEAFSDELKEYVSLANREKLNFGFAKISQSKLVNFIQGGDAIEKFMMQTPTHIEVVASLIQLGKYDTRLSQVVSNWSNASKDKLEDLLPKEFVPVIKRPNSYNELEIVKEWNKNLAKKYSAFGWSGSSADDSFSSSFVEAVVEAIEEIKTPITNPQKAFSAINVMIDNNVQSAKSRNNMLFAFSDYMEKEQLVKFKDEDFLFKYITAMTLVNGKRDNLNQYGSTDAFDDDKNIDDDFVIFFESLSRFKDVIVKDKHNFLRFADAIVAGTCDFGVRDGVLEITKDFIESYFNDSYPLEDENSKVYKLTDGILGGANLKNRDFEYYPALEKNLTYANSFLSYREKSNVAYPKITSKNVESVAYQLGVMGREESFYSQYLETVSKFLKSKASLDSKLYVVERVLNHSYLFDFSEDFKKDVYPFSKTLIEAGFSGSIVDGNLKSFFSKVPGIISKSDLKDYTLQRMVAESQGDDFVPLLKKIGTLSYKNSIQTPIPEQIDFATAFTELSNANLGFYFNLMITQDMKVKDYLDVVKKLPNSVVNDKFFKERFYPNFEMKDQLDYLKQFKMPMVDSIVKAIPTKLDFKFAFELDDKLQTIKRASPYLHTAVLKEIRSSYAFAAMEQSVHFVFPNFNKKDLGNYLDVLEAAASNPDFSQVGFIKDIPTEPNVLINVFFNKLRNGLSLEIDDFDSCEAISQFFDDKEKSYIRNGIFNSKNNLDTIEGFVLNFTQKTSQDSINLVLGLVENVHMQEVQSKEDLVKMNLYESLLLDCLYEKEKEDYLNKKETLLTKISMGKRFTEISQGKSESEDVPINKNAFKL